MVSFCRFIVYICFSNQNHNAFSCDCLLKVLDSVTLENLEILNNNFDGTREGTLIEKLDSCGTSFGERRS